MKQKLITLLLVVVIAGLMSLVVIGSNNKEKQVADTKIEALKAGEPVLYYGETCPHCKDVEKWMTDNKVEEKIKLSKREVWNNRQNAAELSKVAETCGLDKSNVGVPFLYAEEQCLIGTPDITAYFAKKIGLTSLDASASAEGSPSATNN